jgi:streptomycin 6-kinase
MRIRPLPDGTFEILPDDAGAPEIVPAADLAARVAPALAEQSRGPTVRLTFDEGEQTVDSRMIDAGSLDFEREPPLPLMFTASTGDGHDGAVLAGSILAARREPWLAIDPKGVIGEQAYETGALLRNPKPELLAIPQPGLVLARRVAHLSEELGFDRGRVRGWGLAQAVLAACWSLEDQSASWTYFIACAQLLKEVKVEGM